MGLPPRMADTDECGERACFWMAEVIEMHSEITNETGSTATETGRLRYCIRGGRVRCSKLETPEGRGLSIVTGCCSSRFMIFWTRERSSKCATKRFAQVRGGRERWNRRFCRSCHWLDLVSHSGKKKTSVPRRHEDRVLSRESWGPLVRGRALPGQL